MKFIFAFCTLLALLGGVGTWWSYPDRGDGPAVLFWVTDPSPARRAHADGFEAWQIEHGHVHDQGRPLAVIEIDPNNGQADKIVIQGVAGVAGDIIDTRWGRQLRLFQDVGILRDTTEEALVHSFSTKDTWAAIEPEITFQGRQYMFPCNVALRLLWVNKVMFEDLGLSLPPARWTFDEFEAMGRAFVATANAGRSSSERAFFVDQLPLEIMHRGLGLSMFNETLTACDLDDPRYVQTLQRRHRWTYELNLLPTPEDVASIAAEGGWGGTSPQLFRQRRLGLLYSGRYMVIQFRLFATQGQSEPLPLSVTEPPHGGFPNTRTTTRGAGIYAGGPNQEHALRFVEYLASERYSQMIIDDGDALPPNPKYVQTESFLRPIDWPNEWGTHEKFVEAMNSTAIAGVYSEFILHTEAERIANRFADEYDNGLISAQQAAARTAELINARIQRNVEENPGRQALFKQRVERQQQIDAKLAAGEKVPAAWIENPFYLRYYAAQGMLVEGINRVDRATTEGGAS